MALTLEVRTADGAVRRQALRGGSNTISVDPGATYRVLDDATGRVSANATIRRVDNDLVIGNLEPRPGDAPVTVTFDEYYNVCSAVSPCDVSLPVEGSTAPVVVNVTTTPIGALADGSFVIRDPAYSAQATVAEDDGLSTRTLLYGLGGAAIVGLALGGGGGGSDSGATPEPSGATLRFTSASSSNNRKPVLTGSGEPGDSIAVQIDVNLDGRTDVTYRTVVGADGRWSIDMATASPSLGALPPSGLSDRNTVLVSASGSRGSSSLPPFSFVFDDTPPAPPTINPVGVDNVVTGPEKTNGVIVSGTSEPGGTVRVVWGQAEKLTATDASGRWEARFAGAEIPADGLSRVEAIAIDAAGNASLSTAAQVSVNTSGPLLSITSIGTTGDSAINAAEAAAVQVVGSAEPNATIAVTWNGVNRNALTGSDGSWTVTFVGAEVPNPPEPTGAPFAMAIRAVSVAGNASTTSVPIVVDRVAPVATVAVVEGDNRVTPAERANGIPVTGTVEPGANVQVIWNGATRSAAVDPNGNWSVVFPETDFANLVPGGASPPGFVTVANDRVGNVGAPTPPARPAR